MSEADKVAGAWRAVWVGIRITRREVAWTLTRRRWEKMREKRARREEKAAGALVAVNGALTNCSRINNSLARCRGAVVDLTRAERTLAQRHELQLRLYDRRSHCLSRPLGLVL
jgi:hypothetical protein